MAYLGRLRSGVDSPGHKLYADEPLGLDVNVAGKVYALDSSTIDVCLSLSKEWFDKLTTNGISR